MLAPRICTVYFKRLTDRGHLRCRLTKNSPRRTTSTPAGVFCTLLASASSISKGLRLGVSALLLKMFSVSEAARMPLVPCSSEIWAMHKSRRQNAQGWAGHKSETSFGTKLVLHRCTWTYIGGEVQGRTLFNSLFQKAYGKRILYNSFYGIYSFV